MKNSITIMFLCCLFNAGAQVSVFDCAAHPVVSPATINAAGTEFFQTCISTDATQTYNYSGTSNKKLTASTAINIKPGFHAGAYTTGKMWLKADSPGAFDVAVMNYSDLKNVLKYEKLELGVKLPADVQTRINNFINNTAGTKTNPFVDWEMKVETTFIHLSTLTEKKIDGFYYREFERGDGVWNEEATDYKFRVRFAPPLNGTWMAKVKIYLNNIVHSESGFFTFNTVESGNPGYVKVHDNQKNLKRGNKVIFPLGQNFPWPDDGGVWFEGRATPQHWETYLNHIQSYSNMGGEFVRSLIHPHSMDIEWEKLGNYYDRLDFAWEMDNMVDLIEKNNMMLDLNLLYHNVIQVFSDYNQYRWDFSEGLPGGCPEPNFYDPLCYRVELNLNEPKELFTNADAMKYLKQRVRYLLSRYGYSTSIYMFELGSEMYHLGESYDYPYCGGEMGTAYTPYKTDPSIRAAVYQYHTEMSQFIKNTMDHKEHLIGVSYALGDNTAPVYPWDVTSGGPDFSFLLPTVDVICASVYWKSPMKFREYDNDDRMDGQVQNLHVNFGKPVIFSETGHGDNIDPCNNYQSAYIDIMATPFTRIAGMNMWHGYEGGATHTFDEIIRAKNHMNSAADLGTILNSNWNMYGDRNSDRVRHYGAYVAENKEKAAGYIRNTSFNYYTANNGMSPCNVPFGNPTYDKLSNEASWSLSKLQLEGLKPNTDYRMHWYSYRTGTYINTVNFNTTIGGKTDIQHPAMYTDSLFTYPGWGYASPDSGPDHDIRPVLWFVVEQYNWRSANANSPSEEGILYLEDNRMPEYEISINPNPFTEKVEIVSNRIIGDIEVIDVRGNIVLKKNIPGQVHELELQQLSNGVYMVRIIRTGEVVRLVKQ